MLPLPAWVAAYAAVTGRVNRAFASIGIALVVLLMLTILQDVAGRYLLRLSSAWGIDFSRHILTWLFFFGLAPALASGHHVAVDLFESAVPARWRRWLPVVSSALCAIFAALLLWFLGRATLRAFTTGALTPTMISIPVWWVYVAGPVGALQFLLTALLHLVLACLRRPLFERPETPVDAAA